MSFCLMLVWPWACARWITIFPFLSPVRAEHITVQSQFEFWRFYYEYSKNYIGLLQFSLHAKIAQTWQATLCNNVNEFTAFNTGHWQKSVTSIVRAPCYMRVTSHPITSWVRILPVRSSQITNPCGDAPVSRRSKNWSHGGCLGNRLRRAIDRSP